MLSVGLFCSSVPVFRELILVRDKITTYIKPGKGQLSGTNHEDCIISWNREQGFDQRGQGWPVRVTESALSKGEVDLDVCSPQMGDHWVCLILGGTSV